MTKLERLKAILEIKERELALARHELDEEERAQWTEIPMELLRDCVPKGKRIRVLNTYLWEQGCFRETGDALWHDGELHIGGFPSGTRYHNATIFIRKSDWPNSPFSKDEPVHDIYRLEGDMVSGYNRP